jgi:fibronectin type 3 domain-containing protein
MKIRRDPLLWFVLPLILLACSNNDETRLTFDNQTQCGAAAIKVTNTNTGNTQERSLDQGAKLDFKVDHGVVYRYEITYAGNPDQDIVCDPKSGTVMVPRHGQSANFNLQGATPTPQPE